MAEKTTTNFALPFPNSTGLVKVGATDFEELATTLDTLLGEKFLRVKTSAVEITAKAGELVEMTAAATVNLPKAAAANTTIGVFAQKGEVTVKTTSAEKIVGGALPEAGTSVTLGTGQYVVVQYDGTRYLVVSGAPKGYIGGTQLGEGTVRQETGTTQSFLSWGLVSEAGVIEAGSGDFTVTRTGTGAYTISWDKEKISKKYALVATSENVLIPIISTNTAACFVEWYESFGGAAKNTAFTFIVIAAS